jgi:hypothetical protein
MTSFVDTGQWTISNPFDEPTDARLLVEAWRTRLRTAGPSWISPTSMKWNIDRRDHEASGVYGEDPHVHARRRGWNKIAG